jgi:hypothetical protein
MHHYNQMHEQQQQQQQQRGILLQAFLAAARKRLPGAEIVSPYRIPGSPMLLPAAVLPAATGAARASGGKQQGPQHAAAVGGAALEDVQQQQQQQHVGLMTATLGTLQQLRKGQVQFEPEVLTQLRDWQQQEVPVAIFTCSEGPAGLQQQRWLTSSQPQVLLPLAQQWQLGLACAGWGVLLLQHRMESNDVD